MQEIEEEKQGNLKHKTTAGVFWITAQRFSQVIVNFVSGIILARLLSPEDYGLIGMLSIFMLIAGTFIDGGFGFAIIQKKRPTQEDYSTVFFWNLGLAIVLYAVLYLTAPAIAAFYHVPLLCNVLRVSGIVLIINALRAIHENMLNKQFHYGVCSFVQGKGNNCNGLFAFIYYFTPVIDAGRHPAFCDPVFVK